LEAELHKEDNDVTAVDGYWLVTMDNALPRVGSIRGHLDRGLTIRSQEIGMGPFFDISAIGLKPSYTMKETM